MFIAVDDLNDWVGCFGGNPQAITPNLDRLAKQQAMVMNKAYAPSTVCCPSRTALLTGMLSGGTYGSIVNASKNGASYTIRVDVSTEDRRNALKLAVNGLNSGVRPSRTYHARFYGSC